MVSSSPSLIEVHQHQVQELVVTGAYTLEIFMPVATIYPDLPALAPVAISGSYNDLLDLPDLAPVAFSGDYNDLLNQPVISGFSGSYNDLVDKPALAAVALSGAYADLAGAPVLGTAAYENVGVFATAAQGAKADAAWNNTTALYDFGGVVKADGETLSSVGGATALNMGGEPIKRLTLDEATTITLSNLTAGQDVLVRITQGATGGAAAWVGVTKWDGGAAPTLGTNPGDVNDILLSVEPDGTTVLGKLVASYA